MATIRRRGGLFVATAAICVVLATTAVHAESNSIAKSLRGGQRSLIASEKNTYYAQSILNGRRRAEGGEGGEGGQGGEGQGGEGQANEEANGQNGEKQQEQQQQYQEGNNDNQQEQQQEQKNEEENQQEQQQEEEKEDKNEEVEEEDMNDEADANDDQTSFVSDTQEKMSNLMDRFDEDVANIWSTSPSEWDDELWKVFAAVAGAFTLILSCIFYLFCMCCSGDRGDVQYYAGTKEEAENRQRKKNHRGRLFTRMRNNDADTVASGQTRGTEDDKQFVLIEDVDDKSRMGPSSVYANRDDQPDAISPMSSKTGRLERNFAAPRDNDDVETQYTRSSYKTRDTNYTRGADTQYTRGADTQYTRGMTTYKTSRTSKKGILNETVDVWSEFLGFKKVKSYNAAFLKKKKEDEDDYINETDDEISRREKRRTAKGQMKTGTYVAPPEADVEVNLSNSGTSRDAMNERLGAPTPVMSNVISQANQPNSPRRTALAKSRNLLKFIGKSKANNKPIDNSTSIDSKEKALSTKGSKTLSTKGSKTLSSRGSKGLSSNGSDNIEEGDEVASL